MPVHDVFGMLGFQWLPDKHRVSCKNRWNKKQSNGGDMGEFPVFLIGIVVTWICAIC